ncbi:hypothetical protein EJB05_04519, partial [Eragrostis curvula]
MGASAGLDLLATCPYPLASGPAPATGAVDETYDTKVKIGEALEASAREIGDQPVERPDAAAIRVAERCAVGDEGGGAASPEASPSARRQWQRARDEDKVTFGDVLTSETTMKLPTGKAVTSQVAAAEAEAAANEPGAATRPRGVSEALNQAARHNCEHVRAS